MAVPARPTSGVPIETAWGQVAHDAAVAMDIQSGVVSVVIPSNASTATVTLTFPRPFASTPVVVVSQSAFSGAYIVYTNTPGPTVVNIAAKHVAGTNGAATIAAQWIAYGPRA